MSAGQAVGCGAFQTLASEGPLNSDVADGLVDSAQEGAPAPSAPQRPEWGRLDANMADVKPLGNAPPHAFYQASARVLAQRGAIDGYKPPTSPPKARSPRQFPTRPSFVCQELHVRGNSGGKIIDSFGVSPHTHTVSFWAVVFPPCPILAPGGRGSTRRGARPHPFNQATAKLQRASGRSRNKYREPLCILRERRCSRRSPYHKMDVLEGMASELAWGALAGGRSDGRWGAARTPSRKLAPKMEAHGPALYGPSAAQPRWCELPDIVVLSHTQKISPLPPMLVQPAALRIRFRTLRNSGRSPAALDFSPARPKARLGSFPRYVPSPGALRLGQSLRRAMPGATPLCGYAGPEALSLQNRGPSSVEAAELGAMRHSPGWIRQARVCVWARSSCLDDGAL